MNQVLKLVAVDESKTVKFGISSFLKRIVEIFTNISITKYGLILGEFIGNLCSIIFLKKRKIKISFSKTKMYLLSNKKDVVFNFLPEIMITISTAIPTFLIYQKFDLQAVGLYEMTDKFIYLPLALVANPIGIMILDFFSKNDLGKNNLVFFKVLLINLVVSLLMGLFIFFTVGFVVEMFFGNQWSDVSQLVKVLTPFLILRVFVAPFGQVLVARRYLKTFTLIQATRILFLGLLVIPDYKDLKHFVELLVVSQSVFYVLMLITILYTLKRHESSTHM